MSDQKYIKISDEAVALLPRLRNRPALGYAIAAAIDNENNSTVSHIQQRYMSFPSHGPTQPNGLRTITNRLRYSLNASRAVISAGEVVAGIGSNVVYMEPHEFGYEDEVDVPAHQRRVKKYLHGDQIVNHYTALRAGLLSKKQVSQATRDSGKYTFKSKKLQEASPAVTTVKAHKRKMKLKERAPIRHGIEDRLPEYGSAVSRAIVSTWKGGKP